MDRCPCACHAHSGILAFEPVDVSDPVHAALACNSCRDAHCPALLSRGLANAPERPCPEMAVWIDPPISDATGEGSE